MVTRPGTTPTAHSVSTKTVQKAARKEVWTGTRAVAEAVRIADVDVIAAYPIRPYTGIMNDLATMIANGEFQAEIIVADSEHSQFEIVKHASAVGARVFVGSSGVGATYAAEAIVVTGLSQLPVVGIIGCRALDDPGNFGMEWNDALMYRDVGWLVSWARDAQEALDMTLVAYRVSEDRRVLLPQFVAIDGATVTHIASSVEPPVENDVAEFLPRYEPPHRLDPACGPVTKAQHIAPSLIGPEQRKVVDVAMKNAREVIREAWNDYARYVGREYPPFIEEHYMEDAEIAFVTMGAYSKDAVYAAKKLRSEGVRAGVLRIRYWRPFPSQELRKALEGVGAIGALDFSYSFGSADHAGAFFNELRSALYEMGSRSVLMDFMLVGGREPSLAHFMEAGRLLEDAAKLGRSKKIVRWLTLRGDDV